MTKAVAGRGVMTPTPPEGASDPFDPKAHYLRAERGPRFGGLFSFGVELGSRRGGAWSLVLDALMTLIGVSATDFSSARFKVEFGCHQCHQGSKT